MMSNSQICLTPCLNIISWKISPPLSPTNLYRPPRQSQFPIQTGSSRHHETMQVEKPVFRGHIRIVHFGHPRAVQWLEFITSGFIVKAWTWYWSYLAARFRVMLSLIPLICLDSKGTLLCWSSGRTLSSSRKIGRGLRYRCMI